jgi:hypothetical protein
MQEALSSIPRTSKTKKGRRRKRRSQLLFHTFSHCSGPVFLNFQSTGRRDKNQTTTVNSLLPSFHLYRTVLLSLLSQSHKLFLDKIVQSFA